MTKRVYYLTGMGGRLHTGLGQGLLDKGFSVSGRELVGDFLKLDFQGKVNVVAEDLLRDHWSTSSRVIANSFGAYLFLHAQAMLPPYVGQVVLLSPIVGDFENEDMGMFFSPPRAKTLSSLSLTGKFPVPKRCEIHVGADDWQSNPNNVRQLGLLLGLDVFVVPEAGHMLPKDYVVGILDRWAAEVD